VFIKFFNRNETHCQDCNHATNLSPYFQCDRECRRVPIMSKDHKTRDDQHQEDQDVEFRILVGSMNCSDYAQTSFLVPSERIEELCEALQNAEPSFYNWTIDEDTILTDVQNTPASLGPLVRSFDKIPTDKSESELLDWLVHGDDYFSYKYVVLTFRLYDLVDNCYVDPSPLKRVAFEINRKEYYTPFVGFCNGIFDHDCGALDDPYRSSPSWSVDDYQTIDRGEFLKEFGGQGHVVDDDLLELFEQDLSEEGNEYWADKNQHLIHIVDNVECNRKKSNERKKQKIGDG